MLAGRLVRRFAPAARMLARAQLPHADVCASQSSLRLHVRAVSPLLSARKSLSSETTRGKYDATAGKPTNVCDPFENNGDPLTHVQCKQLLGTISAAWTLDSDSTALVREIEVDNFMRGAKLLTSLAAVAFNDGHFPSLTLDRRIGRGRRWQEFVSVRCQTTVLGGLSYRDFLLALQIDAELEKLSP